VSVLVAPVLDAPPLRRFGGPELVFGANPAAGADFVQEGDSGYFVRYLSVFCRLDTDANVANREVVVEYRSGENLRFGLYGAPVTWPANEVAEYAFSAYQPRAEWEVDSSVIVPLGPVLLPLGSDMRIHVVNVQATDQLDRVRFVRERFYPPDEL
jgi:hypothetical protein